jgi:hypothetical protein
MRDDQYIPPPTPLKTSNGCAIAFVSGIALLLAVGGCFLGLAIFVFKGSMSVPALMVPTAPAPVIQPAPVAPAAPTPPRIVPPVLEPVESWTPPATGLD